MINIHVSLFFFFCLQISQPVASGEHYKSLCDDQGSDGNEYEEVPTMLSSDEGLEREETSVELETPSASEQPSEDKEEDTNDIQVVTEPEYVELEEERRDSVDVFPDVNMRDRAKTSPETVQAAGRQNLKKKRHSEGAFEDFVPLFFKRDNPEGGNTTNDRVPRSKSHGSVSDDARPKSVGMSVMEDIRVIRAELDRRNARRLNDEKEEEEEKTSQLESHDQADNADPDPYQYLTEVNFDTNENMSSDEGSDYEQVTGDLSPSAKHGHTSGASYDLEGHRRTLSREGSQASAGSGTSDYLMLFEDWKAVEENGLIVRRNKGSNEKKERRRVFPTDSSASDANMTQSTTQG